jgi:hypothetical protein
MSTDGENILQFPKQRKPPALPLADGMLTLAFLPAKTCVLLASLNLVILEACLVSAIACLRESRQRLKN